SLIKLNLFISFNQNLNYMKKILFAFCFAINLYGWSQVTITEPTEPGTFVYVDKADGGGLALEKITTRKFTSTDIKGENITLRMANPTSTVQIKKQEIMNFVYCYDKTSEGNQLFGFKLVVLTGEKKARKIITNVAPLNEANSVYPQIISGLVTSPYGDNSILIT